MKYPLTAFDLIQWGTHREKDSFGYFTVITGFEGTGGCFWCGQQLVGRRRFCQRGSGCWTRYQEHFTWSYASHKVVRESGYRCQNCGRENVDIPIIGGKYNERSGLEVHHIIPLNGQDRAVSVYNIYWNLIPLCHDCHMLLHAILRERTESKVMDVFQLAGIQGQGIFELMACTPTHKGGTDDNI